MSASEVYQRITRLLKLHVEPQVDESSLHRLSLYVTVMIRAHTGSPAQVAKALDHLQLTGAQAESL